MNTTPLQTPASWQTTKGRRASNEDAVVGVRLNDGRELFAIADGMGGHRGGEVASRRALETLVAALESGGSLRDAVKAANAAVYAESQKNAALTGMGTTLVALLVTGDRYHIANVGDSRAYRIGRNLQQITADHSFAAEAVRNAHMSVDDASRSRWRNALTRAIGTEENVDVDIFGPFETRQPHRVLLCTDGLHGTLKDPLLQKMLNDVRDPKACVKGLLEQAFADGSSDNISVAVVVFGQDSAVGANAHGGIQIAPVPYIYRMTGMQASHRRGSSKPTFFKKFFTLFTGTL